MRFARILLCAAAGPSAAEFVIGDLEEEFSFISDRRGRSAGLRWYCWQVLRSLMPLLAVRVRAGELTGVLLRATLGVAAPVLLLDRLWSFVYSQIPLKDGADRSPEYLALNVLCLQACIVLSRAGVVSATAAAALVLAISAGTAPAPYICILLLSAPAGAFLNHAWRKSR